MNNDRRKSLDKCYNEIEKLKIVLLERAHDVRSAVEQFSGLKDKLEQLRDEEQEYLDNMPPGIQDGDKGSAAQEAIDNMETSITDLETFDSDMDAALDTIENFDFDTILESIDNAKA